MRDYKQLCRKKLGHRIMEKDSKDFVPVFFSKTANSYDSIVRWATFGKDSFWKNKILQELSTEKTVLDLACGTGILTKQIASKLPQAKIIGVDITNTYLEKAKEKLYSYQNILFINQDAEKLDLAKGFDCITASYLPKYCNPDILIKTCLKHLNRGGKIILHDFTYPRNRIMQKIWDLYFKILHCIGFFIPSWKNVFLNLPGLIKSSKWVEEYKKIMKKNGLKTHVKDLTCGSTAILIGTRNS